MKKFFSIILSFIFIFSLSSCASGKSEKQFNKTFLDLFDTASSITAFDKSETHFNEHYEIVYNELKKYSQLFDIYKDYDNVKNLKYINKHASEKPIRVDKEIIDFLSYCKDVYTFTDGYINICMGSVLIPWHNAREYSLKHPGKEYIPKIKDLKKASVHTNMKDLIIDTEKNTVYFKDPKLKLDVGAVAKGYVCDKIYSFILDNQIWDSALINLGGNVKTIGYKNKNEKFRIGIEDPSSTKDYITTVEVSDGQSVITSGGYQRYFTVNNKKYAHIIDPNTLFPADQIQSITIISKDSSKGDSFSTWLFCLSVEEGMKVIEKEPEIDAVWVDKKGEIYYSSGLK